MTVSGAISQFLQLASRLVLRTQFYWGHVTVSGTTYTVNSPFAVAISRSGVGTVTLTFPTAFANTQYGFVATSNGIASFSAQANGTIGVNLVSTANVAVDTNFNFLAVGAY